jgi:hypothetical protein
MFKPLIALAVLPVLPLTITAAQKTIDRDSSPVPLNWPSAGFGSDPLPPRQGWVNPIKATIQQQHVVDLLGITSGTCLGYTAGAAVQTIHLCGKQAYDSAGRPIPGKTEVPNFPGPNDYIIIHVVAWKDPATGVSTQDVSAQNWYVYNSSKKWADADYSGNNRIFGRKTVYLFYLHFNRATNLNYNMRYEMQVASKLPVFLDNLVKLGQLWGIGTAGAGAPAVAPVDVWGMVSFDIDYVPSDLTMTPEALDAGDGHVLATLTAQKLDNEGKYHTDFSVAVPILKITDFTYTDTSGTLAPASYNKQRLLAAFDFHPWAVDLKGSGFDIHPYLLTGVGLGSQPLQRTFFAVGWGPAYANFYAGVLLNSRHVPSGTSCGQSPPAAAPAGAKVGVQSCAQFTFGINMGVGAVVNAMKNNKSSAQTGQ